MFSHGTPAARRKCDDTETLGEARIGENMPTSSKWKKNSISSNRIHTYFAPTISSSLSASDIHWIVVVVVFFFALSLIQIRDDGDLADVHERKIREAKERETGHEAKEKNK